MKHLLTLGVCLLALYPSPLAAQTTTGAGRNLRVVSAGPTGEVASLAEANEIRIVFSEQMVSLGRIPAVVRPPYVRITPAIPGVFRWSGTTILIFTPDAKTPLPYATRYDVTVDATAAAVGGRTLGEPYSFSFTTPTAKLLRTETYRRGGRADAPFVVICGSTRSNRRGRGAPAGGSNRTWDARRSRRRSAAPGGNRSDVLAQFQQVAATAAAASATASDAATHERLGQNVTARESLVVFETVTRVPSQSWVKLTLGAALKSLAGPATPGRVQEYTMKAEPALFVWGFDCSSRCDPDPESILFRTRVRCSFAKSLT
jgi:hypothetical protein